MRGRMRPEEWLLWTQGPRCDPVAEYAFKAREATEVLAKRDTDHPCVYTGAEFVGGSLKGDA